MRGSLPVLIATLLLAAGCGGGGTKFTGIWTNPDFENAQLQKVLVLGISDNAANRRMYEATLAKHLNDAKVQASASNTLLPSDQLLTKEDVVKVVQDNGFDAVIVTRVVDISKSETYVPPTTTVMAYPGWGAPYYGSYYGYYSYGWDVVHSPGYTVTNVTVTLETNLYDAASETIIWSGQSATFNPKDVKDVVEPVTRKLVQEMVGSKLLKQQK